MMERKGEVKSKEKGKGRLKKREEKGNGKEMERDRKSE